MGTGNAARDDRWLRRWLFGLNVAIVLIAIALGLWVTPRALVLAPLVPIAFAPFAYARWRLHQYLRGLLGRRARGPAILAAIGAAGVLLDIVMMAQVLTARSPLLGNVLDAPGIDWAGPVWFSAHALLFLGYAFAALGRWIASGIRRLLRWHWQADSVAAAETEVILGRRQFLQQVGVVGVGAPFAVSLSGVPLSYDFRVEEREVFVERWPSSLDGLRVAHLSDIHVGGAMNRTRLLRVAALTDAARPDLVLHTGDFLTHRTGDFDLPLYEALARIRAPLGQFACLGNHDYDDVDRLVWRLRTAGVRVLRHELVTLSIKGQPVEIIGLDYVSPRGQRPERFARALAQIPPRSVPPRILLNHDPSAFAMLPEGCADLVLSGHTHGGHIGIQLSPNKALTVVGLVGIPDQGTFRRGDMVLHVTRCVGFYGYPMRLGIPPEIAILTLRTPPVPAAHSA